MRTEFDRTSFLSRLKPEDRSYLEKLENEPSLFDLLEAWLERTPFLAFEGFEFWQAYRQRVLDLLEKDREIVKNLPGLSAEEREFQLREADATRDSFEALFEPEAYERIRAGGEVRLSQKALLAALFIQLYRDEPILQMPFQLLGWLQNIDERFTQWRYQHALMVQRMVGKKIGTGGSSGHDYLKRTTENNRFFKDLFMLSSYLIPRSERPELPAKVLAAMRFRLQDGT
jgi:tryptophan 2,3-dioxygenase